MDEFARMMSMEGVRPLDRPKEQSHRSARQSHAVPSQSIIAAPKSGPVGHAWVVGLRARTAL